MKTKEILILGGGAVGCIIANKLAKEMRHEIAQQEINITVLDKNNTFINQGGFTFIPFGLYTSDDIIKPRRNLISPRVKTVFGESGEVTNINLQQKSVSVKSGKKYSYDYLVISTGCEADVPATYGDDFHTFYTSLDEALKLKNVIENLEKGRIAVATTGMPIPCPGAPGKFATLLDDYLRNVKGWSPEKDYKINFIWPGAAIGPPEYNKLLSQSFTERGIEYLKEFKTASVDTLNKEIVSATGDKIRYDLLISIPPHRSVKAVSESAITDAKGWLPSDKYTLRYNRNDEQHDDVYVVGDAGPAELPKTGIGAHYQAVITAQNLINAVRNLATTVRYRGEIGCPFVQSSYTTSQKGKAYIAAWTYNNPQKAFRPTEFGWFLYRMYYYMYWDTAIKGLI